jgi:signal transduction histidine kinase
MMKMIGEDHPGGRVGFTTSPEGTTFSLRLPLAQKSRQAR